MPVLAVFVSLRILASLSNLINCVDRVLYTPEHLEKLAKEAAKPEGQGILTLNDRIGLVNDTLALSKAGLAKLSSALTLVDGLKNETECEFIIGLYIRILIVIIQILSGPGSPKIYLALFLFGGSTQTLLTT
jgi:hypothetical protein